MLSNLCRLAVVCTLYMCATATQKSPYHLVIGDGGYARLLTPVSSLTDLTLAGWFNISQFPYGVAPILTAVSPDAQSQVAFFLRHDGLGVLWGTPPPATQFQLDQVDRHPRTQWKPVEAPSQGRVKRDAVDYSRGLGDIENIMADSRTGRSFDTWSPHSFVDVDTMGVADLEASPSGLTAGLHLLPTRHGFSRSESYNDWTVVPYELTMQESGSHHHSNGPEPRIITEPSGDDDFVLFNWNVPSPSKPSIPQSPNEWSPMWQPDEELTEASHEREDFQPSIEQINIADNNQGWSSHVAEVKLGPNHWNPYRIRGASFSSPKPRPSTPLSVTTTPRPRKTTTTPRPQVKSTTPRPQKITTAHLRTTQRTTPKPQRRTPVTRPTIPKVTTLRYSVPRFTTPQSALRWQTSKPSSIGVSPTTSPVNNQNRLFFSQSSLSIPITTTQKPTTRQPNTHRSTISSTRKSTRMPLWKLIKQPNGSQTPTTKSDTQTTTTQTTTTTTTTTTQIPPTSKITRLRSPQTPSRLTTVQPKRFSTIRRIPSTEATEKPQISGQKSKVSIWSSAEDNFKHIKEHTHGTKWSDKSLSQANAVRKQKPVEITSRHVEEFNRAMEGLPTVKDGNTAVVYSVAISDVDAFNAMYENYQQQQTPKPAPTTRAPVIVTQEPEHEEETNENQLGENNLHLHDSLANKFQNGPEAVFEETVAPAILKQEDAVLLPTEDPLPPTPSRSDIPISHVDDHAKITQVTEEAIKKHIALITSRQENDQAINREDQSTEKSYQTENVQKPHRATIVQAKPYTQRLISHPSSTTQSTERSTTTPASKFKEKDITAVLLESLTEGIPSNAKHNLRPTKTNQRPAISEETFVEKVDIPKSVKTQVIHTTGKPTATTEDAILSKNKNDKLESNNFAVFHITEDDIPYFPEEEEEAEEVFSIEELYQPEGILLTQEEYQPIAHYQEPTPLYHQQLPPEYKHESVPRPIAYGGPVPIADAKVDDSDEVMFSANPQTLIEQGFLPQPVHYVSTPEEANQWMQEQYEKQPQIEERVFEVDSQETDNTVPMTNTATKDNADQNNYFHFRKLPFDFLENQWYHLAFTWSSKDHQVGVYINGELAGTLTDVLPGRQSLVGGGLTILAQTLLPDLTDFDPTSQFIGEMSDINMWSHRLGSEAVKAIYQCKEHMAVSPVFTWQQLTMRFYSDIHIQESAALCGA